MKNDKVQETVKKPKTVSRSDASKIEEKNEEKEEILAKKSRTTRKLTLFIFVKDPPKPPINPKTKQPFENHVICCCGCLNSDETDFFMFSAPNSGAIERHMEQKHSSLLRDFNKVRDTEGDAKSLYARRDALYVAAQKIVLKRKLDNDKFFRKAITSNLPNQVKAHIVLTAWAVANNVSRYSLNDSIFDKYHTIIGIL